MLLPLKILSYSCLNWAGEDLVELSFFRGLLALVSKELFHVEILIQLCQA